MPVAIVGCELARGGGIAACENGSIAACQKLYSRFTGDIRRELRRIDWRSVPFLVL